MKYDELRTWFMGGSYFALVFIRVGGFINWRADFRKSESVAIVHKKNGTVRHLPPSRRQNYGSVCLHVEEYEIPKITDSGRNALLVGMGTLSHTGSVVVVLRNVPDFELDVARCKALLELGVDTVSAVRESIV